jgi:hypothetical protein
MCASLPREARLEFWKCCSKVYLVKELTVKS